MLLVSHSFILLKGYLELMLHMTTKITSGYLYLYIFASWNNHVHPQTCKTHKHSFMHRFRQIHAYIYFYLHLTRKATDLFSSDPSPSQRTIGQSSSHFTESDRCRLPLSVASSLEVLSNSRKVTGGFPLTKKQDTLTSCCSLMRCTLLTSCPSTVRFVTLDESGQAKHFMKHRWYTLEYRNPCIPMA